MKARLIIYGLALAAANVAFAGYTPIAITQGSYNADVIVESNATPRLQVVTSATIDNGTNNTANTLFEVGYDTNNPGNGVPLHGSTFTSSDNPNYSFTMAPSYTAPNGILIAAGNPGGTFTFTSPAAYTNLSFLGLGGNGGDTFNVLVHHQDGSTESGQVATSDWFGGTVGVAIIMGGRCNNPCNLTTEVDSQNPRLYHREMTLTNTTSPVTSVDLSYASGNGGSHSDVMAVSGGKPNGGGLITPIAVTGYNQDFIVEATAPHGGRIISDVVEAGTNVWATSQSLDNEQNTGTAWYEQGYNINNLNAGNGNGFGYNPENIDLTGTGVPHPGSRLTNSTQDHIFQMAPSFTTNDAIYLADTVTNDTITLATPTAFSGISFLAAAGNGPVPAKVVINHQGGSPETHFISVPDWFAGGNAVLVVDGRVAVDTGDFSAVNSGDPILHSVDLILSDSTDPVTSIYIEDTNTTGGGRFSILAVSGNVGALPPSFTTQPNSTNEYVGTTISLVSLATANAPITYQWQISTNGGSTFANLSNGGGFSGATTATLTIADLSLSDQASYRVLATTSGGNAASSTVQVNVFSTNQDVTEPGDTITGYEVSPFGDGSPTYAIDDSMDTKFGANTSGPNPGLIVTPSIGRTILSGIRLYTGSDTTGRDPTSFAIFGSLNGGSTYTLITSNAIALSNNRNPLTAGEAPNPLTQWCTEVDFANTAGYTTYLVVFPTEKGTGQVQFDEMELLGVKDNAEAFFSTEPVDAKVLNGGSASFTAVATFTNTVTVKWYLDNNGNLTPLSDGGNISGSSTTTLTINPASFANVADYVAVATASSGSITSSVAHLYVFSTLPSVTDLPPGGSVALGFGDSTVNDPTGPQYGNPLAAGNLIDDTTLVWQNPGSGQNAPAGFAPFSETNFVTHQYVPVGAWITPAVGSTIVSGLRVYTGQDSPDGDPTSFILQGGDNGTNGPWTTIASGPLNLPLDRSIGGNSIDPTQDPVQEVLFQNTQGYTTYQLIFPTVRDAADAVYLEVAEVQLLGTAGTGSATPKLGAISISNGSINISASGGTPNGTYSILTNSAINAPLTSWGKATSGSFDGSGNLQTSVPVSSTVPYLFYVIKTP